MLTPGNEIGAGTNALLGPPSAPESLRHFGTSFQWTVTARDSYAAILSKLPSILAWEEEAPALKSLGELRDSICSQRLRSALDFIESYDHGLAATLDNALEMLSATARVRFITAPHTYECISRLRKAPPSSIMSLCGYLNAESVLDRSSAQGPKGYWTALGDFYCSGTGSRMSDTTGLPILTSDGFYFAPRIEDIAVDFFSPNVESAKRISVPLDYLDFTWQDREIVPDRLRKVLAGIAVASKTVTALIKSFVKVIIPLKVARGSGSNSKRSFPGRVVLRGVESAQVGSVASSLVHESIHQLLYVLEFAGRFVLSEPTGGITSPWTGRTLPLDSFIHASFVWYGLANFWMQARARGAFPEDIVDRELKKSFAGFGGENPVQALTSHVGMLRYDTWEVARSLQEQLLSRQRTSSMHGGDLGHGVQ